MDSWRAQTKPCANQDPGERSSDHTRDWPRLDCECPGVSNGVVGGQWPATGLGELSVSVHARDLLKEVVIIFNQFSSVQSLSHVQLFATPWTAAQQASLSIINSSSLLKLKSIESVMPSSISSSVVPFFSHLQSFPASGSFQKSQFFTSGGQSIEVPASTSVLLMNIQDWVP